MKRIVSKVIPVLLAQALAVTAVGSTVTSSVKSNSADKSGIMLTANAVESGWSTDYAGKYTTKNVTTCLNIRAAANTSGTVLGTIPANAEFTVIKANGTWANVEYNGINGYSSMDYMKKIADIPSKTEIKVENDSYPKWFLPKVNKWQFSGTVKSNKTIKKIWGGVYNRNSDKAIYNIEVSPNKETYDVTNDLNKAIDTSKLNYGAYTFSLYAEDSSGTYTLINSDFNICKDMSSRLLGDIDADNKLTISDAVTFQKYLMNKAELTEVQFITADMDLNTYIDVFDLTLLRQRLTTKTEEKEKSTFLAVSEYCQHPDYPTGCESAALYILLKYYNVNVTMEQIVNKLPKGPLPYEKNGVIYGANPEKEFVGNPRNSYSYGVFNIPIAKTAAQFRSGVVTKKGASISEIISIIDSGTPVIAWYTSNPDKDIAYNDSWYDYQTNELIRWPAGEHAVVISGHDSGYFTYSDPNTGSSRTISQEKFSKNFKELGSRIVYYNS